MSTLFIGRTFHLSSFLDKGRCAKEIYEGNGDITKEEGYPICSHDILVRHILLLYLVRLYTLCNPYIAPVHLTFYILKSDKKTHQVNPSPQKCPEKKHPCFASMDCVVGQPVPVWHRKLCDQGLLLQRLNWKTYLHLCTLDNQPSQFLASFYHHYRKHILYHLLNQIGEQRKHRHS